MSTQRKRMADPVGRWIKKLHREVSDVELRIETLRENNRVRLELVASLQKNHPASCPSPENSSPIFSAGQSSTPSP